MIDALTALSPAPSMTSGGLMPDLASGAAAMNTTAMDKVAQNFESMFMSQMVQPMFEGLETDALFGGGHGEEVMRGFMVDEYGKAIARHGRFGLADAIKKSMLRAQEEKAGRSTDVTPAVTAAAYQQGQNAAALQQTP